MQKQTRKKFEAGSDKSSKHYQVSEEFKETPEMKKLTQKEEHNKKQSELFSRCVFLLNRETPI